MKVVYCLTDTSLAGGIERSICTKANYLAEEAGYEVTILTTDRKAKQNFFDFSPHIKFIDLQINYSELDRLSAIERWAGQIKKRKIHRQKLNDVLLRIRPDIVISTYSHEFSILCDIKDGSKKIAEHHYSKSYVKIKNERESLFSMKRICETLEDKWKRKHISKYDAFVVLTHEAKIAWKKVHNIYVIPDPLPFFPSRFSNGEHKRIISVGHLTYHKGFQFLLEAWIKIAKKYPDWRLDIFGEGRYYEKLSRMIFGAAMHDRIAIRPPTKDIQEEYINSSLYVMPSLYEGFGLVLTEAMACGLPCISFDCPVGPGEIITHGEDGLLVECKNTDKLAEAISFLIQDSVLRDEMRDNARVSAQRYLPEKIMQRWISLFEQVTGTSGY